MSINYNTLKSMKGMAIGTIMPWAGGEDSIPKGWIACDGSTKQTVDYPDLFDIIGQYYGGSGNFFRLPDLNAKALADMKTSYLPSGTSTVFSGQIGTNQSNLSNVIYTSNLALTVAIDNNLASGTYTAKITGQTINPPAYFDEVTVASRTLGDYHWPTHTHTGNFSSIGRGSGGVESCQDNFGTNPAFTGCDPPTGSIIDFDLFQSGDCCDNDNFLLSECNNATTNVNNYYKNSIAGGIPLGGGFNSNNNRVTDSPQRINATPKNWLGSSDSTLVNTGNFNFATTISDVFSVWPTANSGNDNSLGSHIHGPVGYSVNQGSFQVQSNIVVNDITTGNVAPVNETFTDLLQFNVNTSTPSLRIQYIIKAW